MRMLSFRAMTMLLVLCLIAPLYAAVPAAANTVLLQHGFEDGTTQGWAPRGEDEMLSSSTGTAARTGSRGLHVSGRTESWNGASLDVTSQMQVGQTYLFTGWIKLASGSGTVYMSLDTTKNGTRSYSQLYSATAASGGWVEFKAEYKYREPLENVSVYFEVPNNPTVDFYLDDFRMEQLPDRGPITIEPDIPSLKDVFTGDFLFGAAFENFELIEAADRQLLTKHFNSLTPGNVLKWDSTQPQEGEFNFEPSDQAVQFALDNGQQVRGHTLVWHNQTPDWVFRDSNGNLASKQLLYQRMEAHINEVVGRYKGKIYAWDVVNEVIDASQPDGLLRSLWYQIAGEEYIEKAFEYAHAADPDALLFINDYNTHESAKSQALYNLISRLKAKGIPVHGVGHQTHLKINYPTMSEIDSSIAKFAALNIKQEITELDIDIYSDDSTKYDTLPDNLAQTQATRYKQLFDVLLKHKDKIDNVTVWGKDDGNSWLRSFPVNRNNWPLLFDERLQSKPAYWAIVNGKPTQQPPATPTGLTATAGNAQVSLAWSPVSGATSYTVKRATTSGGPYTNVATGLTTASYTNTGLTNGTTYYYVVSASNSIGQGPDSVQVSATPAAGTQAPSAPTGLAATAGNAQVSLTWNAVSGATSYTVKRATTSGGPYTDVATGLTTASYTNTGLTNGTTYYYVVSASNSAGQSPNSAQVSATPTGGSTASNLVLQYRAADTNAADNQIKPSFNIKNNGTSAVDLSTLKIRYYFTKDGSAAVNGWIDWAQLGGSNIQISFGNHTGTNSDTYVELSFSSGAGSIAAGGQSGEIQLRMSKTDWSNFNEENDYSFDGTKTAFADWDRVVLYQNGQIVWGTAP
ncbi:endo-1,4-beta-xylanase [Paenibacillus sp. FSL W8-0186]|uniref:endo-1,4-beta-xylanase n=1 Tax=Paenibacillus sp. FSL W8-0186 TaxID=2921709 RepID=UPI0030D3BB14